MMNAITILFALAVVIGTLYFFFRRPANRSEQADLARTNQVSVRGLIYDIVSGSNVDRPTVDTIWRLYQHQMGDVRRGFIAKVLRRLVRDGVISKTLVNPGAPRHLQFCRYAAN